MKHSLSKVLAAMGVMLAGLVSCGGQNANIDAPKAVAVASFDAMRASDWATYATTLHTEALQGFQAQIINGLGQIIPRDSLGNPSDSVMILGQMFDTQQLFVEQPDSFMVKILGTLFTSAPDLKQAFSTIQNEILGGIYEGDNIAHLVIRNQYMFQNEPVEEMSVATLRLADGQWKMMLSHQVRGVADMLIQGLIQQAQTQARMQMQPQGNQ